MSRIGESTQDVELVLKVRLPKVFPRGRGNLGRERKFPGLSFFKRCALLSCLKNVMTPTFVFVQK